MEAIFAFCLALAIAASVITAAALGAALVWAVAVAILFCCAVVAFLIVWALSKMRWIDVSVRGPREEPVCVEYYFD